VANFHGNNVSVLLGNGDGTFQPAHNFAAGTEPVSVVVGDFTGDGRLDLAVADTGDVQFRGEGVSVLLGNGDGTFQPAQAFPAGHAPFRLAVRDFNGDGFLDLVVDGGGTLRVLLGNGNGTFQTTNVSYVVGSSPLAVAAGDFDGDGSPDLAVANGFSNDVSILLNDNTWASSASRPGRGRSPQTISAAARDGLAAEALSPRGGIPAALPALPESLSRQERAPTLSAANAGPTERPLLPASAAVHVPPQETPAQFLDRVFADLDANWLWDRSADVDQSVRWFGRMA
jgi:hypothetical protein